ncbi:TraY domain-containing protein [Yersinia rochesterensis]|uniref:TraY domain-containing protein n=1 Tax=Yersinia rochesterensis TaxID=1604335 RepID=UPI0028536556|nr:TraY domain-containing protein [Yersinia rochesterensis]MDR5020240.1 TraY domain-containing protein [Yersinia rochesterensis]
MCLEFQSAKITIGMSPEMNRLLSQSAARSKRTKVKESILRLEDHLKNFPDIAIPVLRRDVGFPSSNITFDMSPEVNRLLSLSSARSKRTKVKEAILRLEDHLKNFPDIATEGKRFREDGTKG